MVFGPLCWSLQGVLYLLFLSCIYTIFIYILKGLSHEIFKVIFWLEWIYIDLKGNRFWFFNFKDVSSILDSNFKY